MTRVIEAFFDGTSLHPEEPLELTPNTRVRLTIESPTPPLTPGLVSENGACLRSLRPSRLVR